MNIIHVLKVGWDCTMFLRWGGIALQLVEPDMRKQTWAIGFCGRYLGLNRIAPKCDKIILYSCPTCLSSKLFMVFAIFTVQIEPGIITRTKSR